MKPNVGAQSDMFHVEHPVATTPGSVTSWRMSRSSVSSHDRPHPLTAHRRERHRRGRERTHLVSGRRGRLVSAQSHPRRLAVP